MAQIWSAAGILAGIESFQTDSNKNNKLCESGLEKLSAQ